MEGELAETNVTFSSISHTLTKQPHTVVQSPHFHNSNTSWGTSPQLLLGDRSRPTVREWKALAESDRMQNCYISPWFKEVVATKPIMNPQHARSCLCKLISFSVYIRFAQVGACNKLLQHLMVLSEKLVCMFCAIVYFLIPFSSLSVCLLYFLFPYSHIFIF